MNVYEMLPNVSVRSGCYNKTGWGGLDKCLFLTDLEVGNSEIKAPADLVSGEHSSSELADGGLLDVSLHGRQRKSSGLVFSYEGPIPSHGLIISSQPNYPPNATSPNNITLGVTASTYDKGTHSIHNTNPQITFTRAQMNQH